MSIADKIHRAGIVLSCSELIPTLDFFIEEIGFNVESIYPADNPTHATIVGFGCRLHLQPGQNTSATLRLAVQENLPEPARLAPNGTRVEFVNASPATNLPPLISTLVLSHQDDEQSWHMGRAGLQYRDLVPDRQGNCVVASHIRIEQAGPVDDYVHFHEVKFQLIFCRKGWVKVVYEDQGPAFILNAGDCLIQPPRIRHRVLESSDNLEVIEIGYPAEHLTVADPSVILPNGAQQASRSWDGQTFIRHIAKQAPTTILQPGLRRLDTGVAKATDSLAQVDVTICETSAVWQGATVPAQTFTLLFVLTGQCHIEVGSHMHDLNSGSSIVVPTGQSYAVYQDSTSELLRINLQTE